MSVFDEWVQKGAPCLLCGGKLATREPNGLKCVNSECAKEYEEGEIGKELSRRVNFRHAKGDGDN